MIRLTQKTLTDGSLVWGIYLEGFGHLDCVSEESAVDLANSLERTTNLQYDGWAPILIAD